MPDSSNVFHHPSFPLIGTLLSEQINGVHHLMSGFWVANTRYCSRSFSSLFHTAGRTEGTALQMPVRKQKVFAPSADIRNLLILCHAVSLTATGDGTETGASWHLTHWPALQNRFNSLNQSSLPSQDCLDPTSEKVETLPLKGGGRKCGEVVLGTKILAEHLHLLCNSYLLLDHVMIESAHPKIICWNLNSQIPQRTPLFGNGVVADVISSDEVILE